MILQSIWDIEVNECAQRPYETDAKESTSRMTVSVNRMLNDIETNNS